MAGLSKRDRSLKMANTHGSDKPTTPYMRLTALEVLEEVVNDVDSDEGDFDEGDESELDEEETDDNSPYPLLVDSMNINNASSDRDDDPDSLDIVDDVDDSDSQSEKSDKASDPDYEPVPSTSTAACACVRCRGRHRARSFQGARPTRGKRHDQGSCHCSQLSFLIKHWEKADDQPPNRDVKFTGSPGIQCNVDNFEPVHFMELFFNEDIINHIVIQTNLYAEQFFAQNRDLPERSRAKDWYAVSNVELKKFLALVLLMGIVKLPAIRMYWTEKVLYGVPVFRSVMYRNRFQAILKFLHFNDNSEMPSVSDPGYDRLYKIRPILDHLHEKFQEVYQPGQAVCVGESLLLWKGRLIFCQNMALKQAISGIRLYLCCEADGGVRGSGGYCFRFKVCASKDDPVKEVLPILPADAVSANLSACDKMAIFLIAPLLNKGYHVYTDTQTYPNKFSFAPAH